LVLDGRLSMIAHLFICLN